MFTSHHNYTILGYSLTIFLSSAILLIIEIVAARLIAPYVGVTIYSWTAIIGVILAGLSLGNWLGGVLADKGHKAPTVGVVLALAGITTFLSLYVLTLVAPMLQASDIDLISASFVYVLTLFFIPAILLGIPTPLLTSLALVLDTRLGRIVGRMHALAALGSIVGTFITGFVLIQYLGSRNIIMLSSAMLLVLSIAFLVTRVRIIIVVVIIAILSVVLAYSNNSFANPCEEESSYFCIRTVDVTQMMGVGETKALILDHLMHGINHKTDPYIVASPYVEVMDVLTNVQFGNDTPLRYYFVGGGAYTLPRLAQAKHPDSTIVVAEIDEKVTNIAREQLYVDTTGMEIIHQDARGALHQQEKQFDVVVADAFVDVAIPYHLVTKEFIALAKSKMSDTGLFMINIVDMFPDPLMVKSLVNTLETEFEHVNVWLDTLPNTQERMTFVVSASDVALNQTQLNSSMSGVRWYEVSAPLKNTGTDMSALPVLSDDYVPVERLVSSVLTSSKGL